MASTLGDVVAQGSRSMVCAYGRGAVVKVPHPDTPDRWIVCEAEYAQAARDAGAPTARLLGLEEVAGRAASVWERVRGPSLWDCTVERPEAGATIGRLLADIHLALLEVTAPVVLPRQCDRLTSKIRRSAALVGPELSGALDLLPAGHGAWRLCHGDLHPSNVLLSRNGPVVVDWFDACRGEPVADVARSSVTMLSDGEDNPIHLRGGSRTTLGALREAYVERMLEALDATREELSRWQAISAVARLSEGVAAQPLLDVWTDACAQAETAETTARSSS